MMEKDIFKHTNTTHLSFIGFGTKQDITKNSSSGGIFAMIAEYILKNGGVVYGAAMTYDNGQLECRHLRIEKNDDLVKLQGSKYVHSKTNGIFKQVKNDLDNGRIVLFSGTSCQVYALNSYVGNHGNLYAVDLVCHGVPMDKLFRDYIIFLEKSKKCKITGMTFRLKRKYDLYISGEDKNGKPFKEMISSKKSAYYKMFLQRAGYRKSCYNCLWANIDKPSDCTLGDFIPRQAEIHKYNLNSTEVYSSLIIHTEKGQNLLKNLDDSIKLQSITIEEMLSHHKNLSQPSIASKAGKRLYNIYNRYGMKNLQHFVDFVFILRSVWSYVAIVFNKRG